MGYSYGQTASGSWALACDRCPTAGGVRKRTCTYKVLTDSLHGGRHALPYCSPPALCSPCYAAVGGAKGLHARCAEGAAASQAEYDAVEARLDAGEFISASGFGSWHEHVPDGFVGRIFRGRAGERYALIPEDADKHSVLSDVVGAKPWCGPDGTVSTDVGGDWARGEPQALPVRPATPKVQPGDTIRFAVPLKFTNGAETDTFTFIERTTFRSESGGLYRITRWKDRDYEVVRRQETAA